MNHFNGFTQRTLAVALAITAAAVAAALGGAALWQSGLSALTLAVLFVVFLQGRAWSRRQKRVQDGVQALNGRLEATFAWRTGQLVELTHQVTVFAQHFTQHEVDRLAEIERAPPINLGQQFDQTILGNGHAALR